VEFVEELKMSAHVPIILWGERMSTLTAERALLESNVKRKKRRGLRDKVSVMIILKNYLDRLKK
jgi:putative Holliday junction resolvase